MTEASHKNSGSALLALQTAPKTWFPTQGCNQNTRFLSTETSESLKLIESLPVYRKQTVSTWQERLTPQ